MTTDAAIQTIVANADVVLDINNTDRPQWLEERRKSLGGSDVAAAAGFSPWLSPYAVWYDKVYGGEDVDSEAMDMGRRLEAPIRELLSDRTGIATRPFPKMLRSKTVPFAHVNLDGLADDDGIVECKNVGLRMAAEWEDGAVPDHYALQGQHALAVTGLSVCHFAVLIGGQTFKHVRAERDDGLIDDMLRIEAEFWEMVESHCPPEVDGSESTTAALKALYANPAAGSMVDLEPSVLPVLGRYKQINAEMAALKKELEGIQNQLRELMGDHEIGLVDGMEVLTYKLTRREGYTVAPTEYRKFHLPKPKKGSR